MTTAVVIREVILAWYCRRCLRSAALSILLLNRAAKSHVICLVHLFVLIQHLLPVFVLLGMLVNRRGVTLLSNHALNPRYSLVTVRCVRVTPVTVSLSAMVHFWHC